MLRRSDRTEDEADLVALRAARSLARRFHVDGVTWLVYEVLGGYDRRRTTLVFESEQTIRRVRQFPQNWRELPDEDLARISWNP